MSEQPQWTECKDNSRETKEYWEQRLKQYAGKPYNGMYLDSTELIDKFDDKNFSVLIPHLESLHKKYGRKLNILEAGCGYGRYVKRLFDTGLIACYVGFDLADANIREAERLWEGSPYMATFGQMDMLNAPNAFKGQKFDCIFLVATMTSIQRNFHDILKGLKTLTDEAVLVFEQDMHIQFFGSWKS